MAGNLAAHSPSPGPLRSSATHLRADIQRRHEEVIAELKARFTLWGPDENYLREAKREWFRYGGKSYVQKVVVVSPRKLGLQPTHGNATHLPNLLVRAEEYGLKLCFDITGPLALLQNSDWFRGKQVYFASIPVDGCIWHVNGKEDRKLRLGTCPAGIREEVFLDELWAFRHPED